MLNGRNCESTASSNSTTPAKKREIVASYDGIHKMNNVGLRVWDLLRSAEKPSDVKYCRRDRRMSAGVTQRDYVHNYNKLDAHQCLVSIIGKARNPKCHFWIHEWRGSIHCPFVFFLLVFLFVVVIVLLVFICFFHLFCCSCFLFIEFVG